MQVIDVMIVEDFPLIRDALSHALDADDRLRVRASVPDGRALLDELVNGSPDIVVMDLHMPGLDGPALIERVHRLHPETKIVVFSASERPGPVLAALRAGASGYLVKRQRIEQVVEGIVAASEGGSVLAPQVAACTVAHSVDQMPGVMLDPMSLRILGYVARGDTDEQIAAELFVSTRTVQNHLARIRSIAGVKRRTELARWAWDNQLV
ncbi:MAG: two component transcriptional regulator, LuxR family [Thermoleophilia bacterium]|nr:two component transcriptional regulator, LuxR family [Thermoleophilia bacterium]MCZ4495679.1 two component transcriptional regulator, LuxR family [Thermoleophilia bacterium]